MSYGLDTISGLIAFVIIGNTGLRGRSRINRLIVLLFGRSPSIAVGTDLQYPTLKKPLGPLVHAFKGDVNRRLVNQLTYGAFSTAVLIFAAMRHYSVDLHATSGLGGKFETCNE